MDNPFEHSGDWDSEETRLVHIEDMLHFIIEHLPDKTVINVSLDGAKVGEAITTGHKLTQNVRVWPTKIDGGFIDEE